MTDFHDDNLPVGEMEFIKPLDNDMFRDAARLIDTAEKEGHVVVREAKLAHVYDRKGYLTLDQFGGPRNQSYGLSDDDVIVQITVRITDVTSYPSLKILENEINQRFVQAKKLQLLQNIELLTASKNTVDANLAAAKKELAELGVQAQ